MKFKLFGNAGIGLPPHGQNHEIFTLDDGRLGLESVMKTLGDILSTGLRGRENQQEMKTEQHKSSRHSKALSQPLPHHQQTILLPTTHIAHTGDGEEARG